MRFTVGYIQGCSFSKIDIKIFNPRRIEFIWGNIEPYFRFLLLFKTKMAMLVLICPRRTQGYICLVHPCVRHKRRVSEIDLSQTRHETAFWWRHNGPVTSQLTDRIGWPNYPSELIGIYVHINTHNKESLTQRCRRSTNVQMCLIFLYMYMVWV